MTDWTDGYRADIEYTYGYYNELNPLAMRLALLNAGLTPPRVRTACELGFGQGISINVHAAASTTQWCGTDFNPAQAGFARDLAEASGAGAHLSDEAFDQFCNRTDLPEFDYIGLHGIWTWISDENRAVLVDFIRRKLSVGGVLYISYNTQPGHAAMKPMRDLMALYARTMCSEQEGVLGRIESTLGFVDSLTEANPAFVRVNPVIPERLNRLKDKNQAYIAHEYFNSHWAPMTFADMAEWLEPAKLQWATSATFSDAVDAINLTPEQQTLLSGISHPIVRQTVRDFCVNQTFRRDYWVKGARPLTQLDRHEALSSQRFLLVQPRADCSMKATGSLGEAKLHQNVYEPVLDALADHKVKTMAQLEAEIGSQKIKFKQLLEALTLLISNNSVTVVNDNGAIAKARKTTAALNDRIIHLSRSMSAIEYLASPVTGGGVKVSRAEQWFLLAMSQGAKTPNDMAKHAWASMASQSQRLVKDGKPLTSPEENLAELTQQAQTFADKRLGILRALQIV